MKRRLFKTLVALLAIAAAATGPARAQNGNLLTTITATGMSTYDETTPGVVNVIIDGQLEYNNDDGWRAKYVDGNQGSVTVTANPGFSIDSCKFYVYYYSSYQDSYTVTAAPFAVYPYCDVSSPKVFPQPNAQGNGFGYYGGVKRIEVYGTVQLYSVRMAAGTEEAANWSIASGDASVPGTQVLENVMSGSELTATYNGTTKKVKSVKAVKYVPPTTPLDNTSTAWTAGTFAVPAGGLTYSDAITVSGDVTLTLTDGETLTLNKGISLAAGATLTVQGNGTMYVNGTNGSTASTVAGSGTLVLTSGTLFANGGNGQSLSTDYDYQTGASGGVAINGNVTINGGTATATGGNGGNLNVTIDDGVDFSHGGNGGVAISGSVTVNAGTWTATNGSNGSYTGDTSGYNSSAGTGGAAVAGTVTDNR